MLLLTVATTGRLPCKRLFRLLSTGTIIFSCLSSSRSSKKITSGYITFTRSNPSPVPFVCDAEQFQVALAVPVTTPVLSTRSTAHLMAATLLYPAEATFI